MVFNQLKQIVCAPVELMKARPASKELPSVQKSSTSNTVLPDLTGIELDHPPAHTRLGESLLASSQGKSRNSDFLTENENIYKGQGA
jgi:hypothetical protein